MSNVFVSYARIDSERADLIASAIQAAGFSVWIDRRGIETGRAYDLQIEEALASAECVVVLWTAASVKSDWVRNEAAEAFRLGKLIPVLVDGTMPPLQLKSVHAVDLRGWDGSPEATELERLRAAIVTRLGEAQSRPAPDVPSKSRWRSILERTGIAFEDRQREREFATYYVQRNLTHTRIYLLCGAVVFGIEGITDFLTGTLSPIKSIIEFILLPVIVVAFLVSLWPPIQRFWRAFIVVGCFFATALIVTALAKVAMTMVPTTTTPVVFIFLLATLSFCGLIPTRWPDTVLVCAVLFVATLCSALIAGDPTPLAPEYVETATSVFGTFVVSSWWREQHARRAFAERTLS